MTRILYGVPDLTNGATLTRTQIKSITPTGYTASAYSVAGTGTADNTHVHDTDLGLKIAATGFSVIRVPFATSTARKVAASFYLWQAAASDVVIAQFLGTDGSTRCGSIAINSVARISLIGTVSGGAEATSPVAQTVAMSQLNRWEILIDRDTDSASVNVYNTDATTPYASVSLPSAGFTTDPAFLQIGSAGGSAFTGWFSRLRVEDGVTTEIGPYTATNALPNLSLPGNQTVAAGTSVSATATASDPDGTIASYAWSVAYSSAAPTLSGASTATVSLTAPAAGNLVILQCTVTDNAGGTATATTEIRVPTTGDAKPLPGNWTGDAGWTIFGGSATQGAALADGSASTGIESPDMTSTATARRIRLAPITQRTSLTVTIGSILPTAVTHDSVVRLYSGGTQIVQQPLPATTSQGNTTVTLTGAQVAAITDWGALAVEVRAML